MGGSCRGGVELAMLGWGGVGHAGVGWPAGVGWVMQGWSGVGHAGVGWGRSCRGGGGLCRVCGVGHAGRVGHAGVGWVM